MSASHPIALGPTEETLLIPLFARAAESRRKRAILRDPKAIEMVASIRWDYERFNQRWRLLSVVLRTAMFDEWVRAFLRRNPEGTVVEIGAGLNTRFERVDNGKVHWFDLDLPRVIDLRRLAAHRPRNARRPPRLCRRPLRNPPPPGPRRSRLDRRRPPPHTPAWAGVLDRLRRAALS